MNREKHGVAMWLMGGGPNSSFHIGVVAELFEFLNSVKCLCGVNLAEMLF